MLFSIQSFILHTSLIFVNAFNCVIHMFCVLIKFIIFSLLQMGIQYFQNHIFHRLIKISMWVSFLKSSTIIFFLCNKSGNTMVVPHFSPIHQSHIRLKIRTLENFSLFHFVSYSHASKVASPPQGMHMCDLIFFFFQSVLNSLLPIL